MIPFRKYSPIGGVFTFFQPAAFTATVDTPTPTFAEEILGTNKISEITSWPTQVFIGQSARVLFLEITDENGIASLDRAVMRYWDGFTFDDPVVVYDTIADPPFQDNPPSGQFLHDLGPPVLLPDGTIGYHIALEYIPPEWVFQQCTGFQMRFSFEVLEYECLAIRTKHPDDIADIEMDWAGFLSGDTIGSVAVTADDLTISDVSFNGTIATARVSGGTAGVDYFMRYLITTGSGITDVRTVRLQVRSCG